MKFFKAERVGMIALGAGLIFFFSTLLATKCSKNDPPLATPPAELIDSLNNDSVSASIADSISICVPDSTTQKTTKKNKKSRDKKDKKSKPLDNHYKRHHLDEPLK